MKDRRTKIIATIGPSSSSITVLTRMIKAGMNITRLNFSHGTHEEHKQLIKNIRSASKKTGIPVGILQDLQGPKIRVGKLGEKGIILKVRQEIVFDTVLDVYKGDDIPVTYNKLYKDVKKGHRILLDDGRLEVKVKRVSGKRVICSVVIGGLLKSNKGMNLPDSQVSQSAFTKKDKEDLLFGLEQGVDWIALSFVTSPEVIIKVKDLMRAKCRTSGKKIPFIISKIERKEAVERFEEILEVSDGIMLARGDLGIEIPFEEVPIVQKQFVEICRQSGKPMVIATHMLDSMVASPRATRAEISDVANAVIDHADAVMLSAESASGDFPDIAVKTMATVIDEVEESRLDDISFFQIHDIPDIATAIAQALHTMAENGHIDLIATSSTYGDLAKKINVFRPNVPIVMACPDNDAVQEFMMRSGIYPFVMTDEPATFIHRMQMKLKRMKLMDKKTRIAYVIVAPRGDIQLIIR